MAEVSRSVTLANSGEVVEAKAICRDLLEQAYASKIDSLYDEALNCIVNAFLIENKMDSVVMTYNLAKEGVQTWSPRLTVKYEMYAAMSERRRGNSAVAFEAFKTVIPKLVEYPYFLSFALQEYGSLYYYYAQRADSAMYYVDSAMAIVTTLKDSVRQSSVLESHASIAQYTGSYLEAIDYAIRAMSFVSQKNRLKKFQLLQYISEIFQEAGLLDRAKEYARQALDLAEQQNYHRSKAIAQSLLGDLYFEQAHYDSAEIMFVAADEYFEAAPRSKEKVRSKCNIARIALQQGLPERALSTLMNSATDVSLLVPSYVVADYYRILGSAHVALQNYSHGREHLYKSLEVATQVNDPRSLLPTLLEIQSVEETLGNYKAAFDAASQYRSVYDSTFQLRQLQLVFESEARYQRSEQEKAITQLNADNALKDLRLGLRENQIRYGILALALITGLGVYVFYLYRQVRRAKKKVDQQNSIVSKALKEKEVLLKEIHHRVKNNLQVVSSLLSLQSRYIEDQQALEAINEGRNRVRSMALIHQNLYQGEHLTGIHVKPYFDKVVRGLFNSYNTSADKVNLDMHIDDMLLDVDSVIPIGLIVNELVSNALKYAFPDGRQGSIFVSLTESKGKLILKVADDGIGMGNDWQEEYATSFGYRLIHSFREKLEADLHVTNHTGTTVEIAIRDYQRLA